MWRSTSMDSTTTGRPCVCILWRGGVSCHVSVYCDGVGWHVMCLHGIFLCGSTSYLSKYHCYKRAPARYDIICCKATLNHNKQTVFGGSIGWNLLRLCWADRFDPTARQSLTCQTPDNQHHYYFSPYIRTFSHWHMSLIRRTVWQV